MPDGQTYSTAYLPIVVLLTSGAGSTFHAAYHYFFYYLHEILSLGLALSYAPLSDHYPLSSGSSTKLCCNFLSG